MAMVRDFDEVGRFDEWSDRVNEAYRTYASLWLDNYDDNIDKFKIRLHDVQPVRERNLPEYSAESEPLYYEAYMDAATDFVTEYYMHGGMGLKPGYWTKNYPLLAERAEAIQATYDNAKFMREKDIPSPVDCEPVSNLEDEATNEPEANS